MPLSFICLTGVKKTLWRLPPITPFAVKPFLALSLFSILLTLLASPTLYALNVSNTNSTGIGSLRLALTQAPQGDTITFDLSLSGQTINLSGSELTIFKTLTIDASNLPDGITIDADSQSRIFNILPGSIVTFNSLKLINGHVTNGIGGAILNNRGSVTLNHCTLSNNFATLGGGAIFNSGDSGIGILDLSYCILTGNSTDLNGGAINSDSGDSGEVEVSLHVCTVSSNTADSIAGGIYAIGTNSGKSSLDITFSSIFSNSSYGIYSKADTSSQAYVTLHTCTVMNSIHTIANNSPYLSLISAGRSRLDIKRCTLFSLTSESISTYGIIDDYSSQYSGVSEILLDHTILTHFNEIGEASNATTTIINPNVVQTYLGKNGLTPTLTNASVIRANPQLGQLGDYGGPTLTAPPLPDSPAVDAGGTTYISGSDQRGVSRFRNGALDIGAVEVAAGVVDSVSNSGQSTLREFIDFPSPGITSITFDPALSGATITLAGSPITIDSDITIDATTLPDGLTIDGNSQSRIFNITPGNMVRLNNLTLTGGQAVSDAAGGAIFNQQSELILRACTIHSNSATYGGAIINDAGNSSSTTLRLYQCTITNNSAEYGGAIYNYGANSGDADLILDHCTVTENHATVTGGGVYNHGTLGSATTTLSSTILAGNSASNTGPDLAEIGSSSEASTTLHTVNLLSDTTGSNGLSPASSLIVGHPDLSPLGDYGGPTHTMPPRIGSPAINSLNALQSRSYDQRGKITYNFHGPDIGAVEVEFNFISTLADSGSGSLRSAIQSATPAAIITFYPSLSGETLPLTGGELFIDTPLSINASNLAEGLTINGGGQSRIFRTSPGSDVTIDSLTLTEGVASNVGGAIWNSGASMMLKNCTVTACSAPSGGAIFNGGANKTASLHLSACTLTANSATSGGAIYNYGENSTNTSLKLDSCTLTENSAAQGGGIINVGHSGNAQVTLTNTILAGNTASSSGPDLAELGTLAEASTTLIDQNLLSDTSGNNGLDTSKLIVASPLLTPLGNYGGPTQTMPPLTESPALNAGSSSAPTGSDQRGFTRPRGGALDIGAVETDLVVVSSLADSGVGSLRDTLGHVPAGDIVTFHSALSGQTITLGGTQLTLNKDLTIDGSNLPDGITITGNGQSQIFGITPGNEVTLNYLNLTGGNAANGLGGAISSNNSNVHLNYCTLYDNFAKFGGGGIFIYGGNSGDVTLNLSNSTIANNSTDSNGGGIYINGGNSGAAFTTITSCTLVGNAAEEDGGGIYHNGDGGSATLELKNTILANNTAVRNGSDLSEFGSAAETRSNLLSRNIISDTSGTNILSFYSQIIGAPLIAPLGDYGGPTLTMPPLPGSPAIEKAVFYYNELMPSDQRGTQRPLGPLPDIGAVEARAFAEGTLTDTDNDDIPDILEGPNGSYPHLVVGVDDKAVDSDGDGSTDAEEISNMTDLLDSGDYFRVLSIVPATGFDALTNPMVSITFPSFPGLEYEAESSQNMDTFTPVPDSTMIADEFTETIQVQLTPGDSCFGRMKRK